MKFNEFKYGFLLYNDLSICNNKINITQFFKFFYFFKLSQLLQLKN